MNTTGLSHVDGAPTCCVVAAGRRADYRVLGPRFFALATSVDARLVPAGAGRSAPLARMAPSPWRCSGGRAGMVAVEAQRLNENQARCRRRRPRRGSIASGRTATRSPGVSASAVASRPRRP